MKYNTALFFFSMPEPEKTDMKKQAWLTAFRLLAASSKSRQELAKKLRDKGYPENVIQEILDGLEKQRVLNDQNFASNLLTRYTQVQPSGSKRIAFERYPPALCRH